MSRADSRGRVPRQASPPRRTRDRSPRRDSRGRGSSYGAGSGSSYGAPSYGGSSSYGAPSYGGSSSYGAPSSGGSSSYGAYGAPSQDRYSNFGNNLRAPQSFSGSVEKNFYREHADVRAMSAREADAFRAEHSMKVKGANVPNPITKFRYAEGIFPDEILRKFEEAGFSSPSPIQAQGWPIALSGVDTIGIAQTGSGKTLSFLLPALVHLKAQAPLQRGDGPIVLVLAPTRELVQQIEVEAKKFLRGVRCVSLVGGMPKGPQCREMREGREIVVATPGRLLDLIEMGVFNLTRTSYLCLDEADRMLDMGFEKPIRQICGQIRRDRQTLFWSATWPKEVERLAHELCDAQNLVHLTIGSEDLKANERVTQFIDCDNDSFDRKFGKMQELLTNKASQGNDAKSIVFCKTKRGCDDVARALKRGGFGANSIHGDKEQRERDWVLNEFKGGRASILVATDVAARGLDVKGVELVINFDFPMNVEDYVHRIGRTGRAGAFGESYTFFVERDLPNAGKSAKELIKILVEAKQEVPHMLEDLARNCRGGGKGSGRGGKGKGKGGFGGSFGGRGGGFGGGYGRF